MIIVLAGIAVLASQQALPGDPFYGVKRGLENASVGLTADEARKRLELATDRITELRALSNEASPAADGYRTALDDFDAQTLSASRLLTTASTNGTATGLTSLAAWTTTSKAQLATLAAQVPATVHGRVEQSIGMLTALQDRIGALQARLNCSTITTGRTDRFGAVPAAGSCTARPAPAPVTPAPSGPHGATPSPAPAPLPMAPMPSEPNLPPPPQVPTTPYHPAPAPALPPPLRPQPGPIPTAPVPPRSPVDVGGLLGGIGSLFGG